MLEQLMGLIQDHSQEAIVKNPAIPNQHNNDAMQTVLQSVMGGLQNEAQGGNVGGLMGLLSGQSGQGGSLMNNPIVAGIAQNAIGSLMEKFGLSNCKEFKSAWKIYRCLGERPPLMGQKGWGSLI